MSEPRYIYVTEGFWRVTWAIIKEALCNPRGDSCIVIVHPSELDRYVQRRVDQNEGG